VARKTIDNLCERYASVTFFVGAALAANNAKGAIGINGLKPYADSAFF
jgi:hypothetical protein